jgi:hypothetical protein
MQPSTFNEMDDESVSQSRSWAFPNTDRSPLLVLLLPPLFPQDQAEAYLTDRERRIHAEEQETPIIVPRLFEVLVLVNRIFISFSDQKTLDSIPLPNPTIVVLVLLAGLLCFLSRRFLLVSTQQ